VGNHQYKSTVRGRKEECSPFREEEIDKLALDEQDKTTGDTVSLRKQKDISDY